MVLGHYVSNLGLAYPTDVDLYLVLFRYKKNRVEHDTLAPRYGGVHSTAFGARTFTMYCDLHLESHIMGSEDVYDTLLRGRVNKLVRESMKL
jgi:hypothetical protein